MKKKKRELTELFEFKGKKVYQEDKLFEPETISSWKEKGQIVYGTNIERMASGRAPIGVDCRPIMLISYNTRTKWLYKGGSLLVLSREEFCRLYSSKHKFYPKNILLDFSKIFF